MKRRMFWGQLKRNSKGLKIKVLENYFKILCCLLNQVGMERSIVSWLVCRRWAILEGLFLIQCSKFFQVSAFEYLHTFHNVPFLLSHCRLSKAFKKYNLIVRNKKFLFHDLGRIKNTNEPKILDFNHTIVVRPLPFDNKCVDNKCGVIFKRHEGLRIRISIFYVPGSSIPYISCSDK